MSLRYSHEARADGVHISLERHGFWAKKSVPIAEWREAGGRHGAVARHLLAEVERGRAAAFGDAVCLPHPLVAALPAGVAEALGLPPLGTLSITLAFQGIMTDPRALIRVSWYDPNDRRIRIERIGSLAQWGKTEGRLSRPVFELVEAIDRYNASEGAAAEVRIAAWAPVQAALKQVGGDEVRTDDGFLTTLTVYQAGAVALDVFETPNGPDFLPVVMGREKSGSLNDDAAAPEGADDGGAPPAQRDLVADALLPPALQKRFASEIFVAESKSRDAYVLDRNVYLVLDPSLKAALDVVRQKRSAPRAERSAFLRNPRSAIAAAIGDETGEAALSLLVETWQYSERVLGLALWEPPALPWLKSQAGQWLPERFPVRIGALTVEIDEKRFREIRADVASAAAEGRDQITIDGEPVAIADVEAAFADLPLRQPSDGAEHAPETTSDHTPAGFDEAQQPYEAASHGERLVIRQNLDGAEFVVAYSPRDVVVPVDFPGPSLVRTQPKSHQVAGFDWLVAAYGSGWPGVLLADDMGLGKTFQALAFLAWVKKNRAELQLDRGARKRPVLIVAPTALLRNWIEEAERHLGPDALGTRVDAFGTSLRRLKPKHGEGWSPETALDVAALRAADWVLTTYETLADNHRAFARIPFSVAVFDEAQKIKSPGAINTQSAKAMNVDFVLCMTGTPIENRLADLWCIMDRVVPGYLGDLKTFVSTYEDGGEDEVRRLKGKLDRSPAAAVPPVLLRRMKHEILEGLPDRRIERRLVEMPLGQSTAYRDAVVRARVGTATQGDMLRAIHAFRSISLHPVGARDCNPLDESSVRDWISASARTRHAVEVLEGLSRTGEKALVFIEDLEIQSLFAAAVATRLGLDRQPAIINGTVPGERRLEIVERFQNGPPGFDLLVLSPKAAGVGLTITAANHVIHLSRWWNPAVEDQCNDRCYRIGQRLPVTVHIPIAVHPDHGDASFDVKLDELLERKRRLSRDMLLPPVSDGDVQELFGGTTRD